jgi:hypothetical protein
MKGGVLVKNPCFDFFISPRSNTSISFFLPSCQGFSVLEISFVIGRIWDKESNFAFAAQPFLEQRPAGRNQVFYSSVQGELKRTR